MAHHEFVLYTIDQRNNQEMSIYRGMQHYQSTNEVLGVLNNVFHVFV